MKYYTKDHEWLQDNGDGTFLVGITNYAQQQLGDVVFVELPKIGKQVVRGGDVAVVESVKAASEVYAPVDGTVVAVNDMLTINPALVNTAAESDGWFFVLKADANAVTGLLDEAGYTQLIG